jgi:hypothetical protein
MRIQRKAHDQTEEAVQSFIPSREWQFITAILEDLVLLATQAISKRHARCSITEEDQIS